MTEILPQYNEDGSEELSFFNMWRGEIPQTIENAENTGNIDTPINPTGSLIPMFLTDEEFTEILSALYAGAEFAYPEKYLQIIWNFLKGVQLPVTMPEQCYDFPPYSVFISYPLQNPYTQPDETPDGYLYPPMVAITAENSEDFPQNEIGDIVAVFGSFPLDTGWFDDIHEAMPSITIRVVGSGTAEIKLLNQTQGGLAIVTLDNPPDLVDILAGIITGADNIIDVNLDSLSVPPETAVEHIYPVTIEGEPEEEHTIYIVFFPIIDDSIIPLRFGGGFRGVELCGFMETPEMGIADIRYIYGGEIEDIFRPPLLQKFVGGEWVTIELGYDVGLEIMQSLQIGLDGVARGTSLRNLEPFYSTYYGEEAGWPDSPLKAYIDAGGTPFDPTSLETAIAAAQSAAADAQSTADGAVTVNDAQTIDIAALDTRVATAEGAITDLDTRLTALEADALTVWTQHFDFKTGQHGFVGAVGTDWTTGIGYDAFSALSIDKSDSSFLDGRIAFYRLELVKVGIGEAEYTSIIVGDSSSSYGVLESGLNVRYHKLGNMDTREDLDLLITSAGTSLILEGLTIYGYGDNNWDDD